MLSNILDVQQLLAKVQPHRQQPEVLMQTKTFNLVQKEEMNPWM